MTILVSEAIFTIGGQTYQYVLELRAKTDAVEIATFGVNEASFGIEAGPEDPGQDSNTLNEPNATLYKRKKVGGVMEDFVQFETSAFYPYLVECNAANGDITMSDIVNTKDHAPDVEGPDGNNKNKLELTAVVTPVPIKSKVTVEFTLKASLLEGGIDEMELSHKMILRGI